MQLSTHQDIDAPVQFVFRRATDFAGFERQAMRRGADVRRIDTLPDVGIGSVWEISFQFRSRDRTIRAHIVAMDLPNGYSIESTVGGIDGKTVVDLVALSPNRTRLSISNDFKAQTLAGRLLLQSLKLARSNLNKRFEKRIETFAMDVQERWARKTA